MVVCISTASQFGDIRHADAPVACRRLYRQPRPLTAGDSRAKKTFGRLSGGRGPARRVVASRRNSCSIDGYDEMSSTPAADTLDRHGSVIATRKTSTQVTAPRTYDLRVILSWSSAVAAPRAVRVQSDRSLSKATTTIFRASDPTDLWRPTGEVRARVSDSRGSRTALRSRSPCRRDTGVNGAWVDQQTFTINHNGESIEAMLI